MSYQAVFKRYELKYIVDSGQKSRLIALMSEYMDKDRYGKSSVLNLYFDTDDYRLIRRSVEKPKYKEKLRIRSYRESSLDDEVFVEIKKKYDGVVYKRRLCLSQGQALDWIEGKVACPVDTQIGRELDYFISFYGNLRPKVFLSYEREAYLARDGSGLRITFDSDISFRCDGLCLEAKSKGVPIFESGKFLCEIKCNGGMPLWLAGFLSREKIYKTSFSKYGTAYEKILKKKEDI